MNPRPLAPHASTLPGCATPRIWVKIIKNFLSGNLKIYSKTILLEYWYRTLYPLRDRDIYLYPKKSLVELLAYKGEPSLRIQKISFSFTSGNPMALEFWGSWKSISFPWDTLKAKLRYSCSNFGPFGELSLSGSSWATMLEKI